MEGVKLAHVLSLSLSLSLSLTHLLSLSITSGESASGQEAPPTMPHLLNLDLSDGREEKVPSESDVQDILTSAHAPHTQVCVVRMGLVTGMAGF